MSSDPVEKTSFHATRDSRGTDDPSFEGAVAIAASAGGLSALSQVLTNLPADFPAAIVVVQHLAPDYPSSMAQILNKRTRLEVRQAVDGDRLLPGLVLIAPPDFHLLVNPDFTLTLSHTELIHHVRPSADPLFISLAAHYRERAVAVVLTGTGKDGSLGLLAVKKWGGLVIAQDEATSAFFGMPGAAIGTGNVDMVLPLDKIGPALAAHLARKGTRQ
jgi:two-component system, chemotaxis family, protein-glutamate methylesterase/glutaminase